MSSWSVNMFISNRETRDCYAVMVIQRYKRLYLHFTVGCDVENMTLGDSRAVTQLFVHFQWE